MGRAAEGSAAEGVNEEPQDRAGEEKEVERNGSGEAGEAFLSSLDWLVLFRHTFSKLCLSFFWAQFEGLETGFLSEWKSQTF